MTKQILPENTQLSAVTPRDELRLSDQDAAHEAHIKTLGDQVMDAYSKWARTGCFAARGELDAAHLKFKAAIAQRSPEAVACMEAERGLA